MMGPEIIHTRKEYGLQNYCCRQGFRKECSSTI